MSDQALHHLTEVASRCCTRAWSKLARAGTVQTLERWECPVCGCEYVPRPQGAIVQWESDEWLARL